MGLTASIINNKPEEIATLMTITEGKRIVSPAQFRSRYVETVGFTKGFGGKKVKVKGLKNTEHLKGVVQPRVDYVETGDIKAKAMPVKDVKNVDVQMSPRQYRLYQLALNKLGPIKSRIARGDENVTVREAENLFSQVSQARQLANSIHTGRKDVTPSQAARRTPKAKKILDDTAAHLMERPDNKVVLYSNLIRGGVDVLSAGLKDRGIDHAVFVGKGTEIGGTKITAVSRQSGVQDYKKGKKRVIVLSGAGAEGLSLGNSTAFFAMDGHFNPQRVLQAEARARRLGGQKHRPVEERKVEVRRYRSVAPASERPGFFGKLIGRTTPKTTDEWMYGVAGRKFRSQKQFHTALKEPPKYVRKYKDAKGRTRYVYRKEPKQRSLFSRLFGSSEGNPAPGPKAKPVGQ